MSVIQVIPQLAHFFAIVRMNIFVSTSQCGNNFVGGNNDFLCLLSGGDAANLLI
ncbi:hypothetical protein ACWJS0_27380 [Klebsiella pneumoniae]|uniref:hypothetical protein n=1 Tax=Klebsiella pneumoniae TaxID=573 RepID=UPI00247FF49E|nr:hypothetical protein [Klebsiella pneumoniae]